MIEAENIEGRFYLVPRLASWFTIGATTWLALVHFVSIGVEGVFVFMIAAIVAFIAAIFSIVKTGSSSN